jgi:type VI secretion system protein ImpF
MAPGRQGSDVPVMQSLLVRLTEDDEDDTAEEKDWATRRAASLRKYRNSVKRDIEWLLNTRRPRIDELRGLPLASRSVLQYGLNDISDYSGLRANPELLVADLLDTLRTFEPRITDVRIVLERSDEYSRDMCFRVEGRLRYTQGSEEIRFDTVLGVIDGQFDVR